MNSFGRWVKIISPWAELFLNGCQTWRLRAHRIKLRKSNFLKNIKFYRTLIWSIFGLWWKKFRQVWQNSLLLVHRSIWEEKTVGEKLRFCTLFSDFERKFFVLSREIFLQGFQIFILKFQWNLLNKSFQNFHFFIFFCLEFQQKFSGFHANCFQKGWLTSIMHYTFKEAY